MKKKRAGYSALIETLTQFRHKGGAWQSQPKAEKLLLRLKGMVTEGEHYRLRLAHSHYKSGDNDHEVHDACNLLIRKYQETMKKKDR